MTRADTSFKGAFAGRTVLVTGHTGFKGAWLSLWLTRLGARVVGYAQAPMTPSLFDEATLGDRLIHHEGDVRDRAGLEAVMAAHRPEFVFHLAAQPLVRASYRTPVETFETNVMGTVNLLEAVRQVGSVRACVVVTSDKCYDNQEWVYAYREADALGGRDPYSASKGAAEIVAASYRQSFFGPGSGVGVASVRAGNVIGGGDFAEDRIVPDAVRAVASGVPLEVRQPAAIRPWQHVLEPLSGYLWLGARLAEAPEAFAGAWNFGPGPESHVSVGELIPRLMRRWGRGSWHLAEQAADAVHEARFLKLDATKAASLLGWRPMLNFETTLDWTVAWYAAREAEPRFDARAWTLEQIARYEHLAAEAGAAWAPIGSQIS